jgi:nucleotide-binding universal stress UspA family protein
MLRSRSLPCLKNIFHPSDFSEASNIAFVHALQLALGNQGRLTILHTGKESRSEWAYFPRVRQTLERWEVLPPHSNKDAILELGLDVEKVFATQSDPVRAVAHYLSKHPQDLIVLMTHQHDGFERLLHKSAAEPIARLADEMTLFVPQNCDGFVSLESGAVNLQHILLPVDHLPNAQVAVAGAAAVASSLGCQNVTFTMLHVGDEKTFPQLGTVERENWHWQKVACHGHVEQLILQAAHDGRADLIVMPTLGHHGFLDALRGSTTERIVRNAPCPVLAVPAALATERVAPSRAKLEWQVGV